MFKYSYPFKPAGAGWNCDTVITSMAEKVAAVVGVTGIVGFNLARYLLKNNWKVYGISRRKQEFLPESIHHVSADLTDQTQCKTAFTGLKDVKYAFYACWQNRGEEKKNCKVNQAMIENFIDNLPAKLKHFALVTGTKHYVGSFETISSGNNYFVNSPFKEDLPRLPEENFYYNQEDVMFDRAEKLGFTWSVARPGIIIGFAPHNIMNLASSIAVYATLCKHLDLPFIFPGGKKGYEFMFEVSDARLIAEHLVWEASTPEAANQAFNVVNGDLLKWKFMWKTIADYFGLKVQDPLEVPFDLDEFAKDKEPVWAEIVAKYSLKKTKMSDLVGWWFLKIEVCVTESFMSDMNKSRERGFLTYQNSEKSFLNCFDTMREYKYIP